MEWTSRKSKGGNPSSYLSRGDERQIKGSSVGAEESQEYTPKGGALELMRSRDRVILIEGPTGTGKSRAVLEKVYLQAMKHPGIRILLCRKSRESMSESVLVTWEQKVLPKGSSVLYGQGGQELLRTKRHSYKFGNGSEIIIGGLNKPSRIMSTDYDVVAVFEGTELTESDVDALITRLRNERMPYQQLIVDCNPAQPSHHLNQRALRGDMKRILSRHADNPSVTAGYLEGLSKLTGVRRLRFLEGKWAAQEGLVYECWDSEIHLVDGNQLLLKEGGEIDEEGNWIPDKRYRIIRSIDFGFRNPSSVQWWAISPQGRLILYRELYTVHQTARSLGELIKKYTTKRELIEETVRDHDASAGEELASQGIRTVLGYKSFLEGYDAVVSSMKLEIDGWPGLVVLRDSLLYRDLKLVGLGQPCGLSEEMQYYSWKVSGDRVGEEKRLEKEVPVDMYNHSADAMRYAVSYAKGLGKKQAGISW